MVLEGTVTNVTNFGAFVDIGVHQDGLVHISMLADRFVKDPHEVVKAGEIVKVKVLEVDEPRKRIALTMRLEEPAVRPRESASRKPPPQRQEPPHRQAQPQRQAPRQPQAQGGGAMAEALANALKRGR